MSVLHPVAACYYHRRDEEGRQTAFLRKNPVGLLLSLTMLVGVWSAVAGPLDQWQWQNPRPQGNHLSGVTYGNGRFLAVGLGAFLTSSDGIGWTNVQNDISVNLGAICYGKGKFLGITSLGLIADSSEGVVWQTRRITGLNHPTRLAFCGNRFVILVAGAVWSSEDGITWGVAKTRASGTLWDVTYGNGMFVIAGQYGLVLTSTNGVSWTRHDMPTLGDCRSVAYGNGLFAVVTERGEIFTSTNGDDWAKHTVEAEMSNVIFAEGRFVAVGTKSMEATFVISTNGVDWTQAVVKSAAPMTRVAYGNGTFVSVGWVGSLASSSDLGMTWTDRSPRFRLSFPSLTTVGDDGFMIGNYTGNLLRSSDGVNWTNYQALATGWLRGLSYGNGLFVAAGDRGMIMSSVEGFSWTQQVSGTFSNLGSPAFLDGNFYVFGRGGIVLKSADAIHWKQSSSGAYTLGSVAVGNGTFVGIGSEPWGSRVFMTSTNGESWVLHGSASNLTSVAFGNHVFVAAGGNWDEAVISTSPDGVNWTQRWSSNFDYCFSSVTYSHGVFVAVGRVPPLDWPNSQPCVIFTSVDGISWTNRYSGATDYLVGIAGSSNRFVAVGWDDTLLSSGPLPRETRLGIPERVDVGTIRITGAGLAAKSYALETSTDLTEWVALTNVFSTDFTLQWADSTATNSGRRFYRAASRP